MDAGISSALEATFWCPFLGAHIYESNLLKDGR